MIFPRHPHHVFATLSLNPFKHYSWRSRIRTIANLGVSFMQTDNSLVTWQKTAIVSVTTRQPMKRGKTVIRVTSITWARSRIIQNATLRRRQGRSAKWLNPFHRSARHTSRWRLATCYDGKGNRKTASQV